MKQLGILAIAFGAYGLTPLPMSGFIAAIGAIVVGVILLTR